MKVVGIISHHVSIRLPDSVVLGAQAITVASSGL